MTNPPQYPNPGGPGQPGPGEPQYPPYSQGPQGFPGQSQPYQPQPYQPQPGGQWPQQGQPWPQQGPGFPPPGMPPQQWGAPPPGPRRPIWKSPIVLIAAAVVLLFVVVGLIFAIGRDDSASSGAASSSSTTSGFTTRTGAPSTTRTSTRPTTTSKAPAPVPAALQPIVDALPAPLRAALSQHEIRQKPGDDMLGYDVAAGFTLNAKDPMLQGLMHWPSNDYYPVAYISTKPDELRHIWANQHPDWTSDQGSRLVRIDPGDQYSGGTATVEVFLPQSNLYFEADGFQSADAAKQFVQRAGF